MITIWMGQMFEFLSQGPRFFSYKTYDTKGNQVIVRYNYEHLNKVLEARLNVRRYSNG